MCALVALAWAPAAPAASAQISFVQPPAQLDFDKVAKSAGQVEVAVKNDSTTPQIVEVRLVGLAASSSKDNPTLGSVAPSGAVSKTIAAEKTEKVVLNLRTAARPKPGTYLGTLVAAASGGVSATSPVTLTVAEKATTTPEAGSASPPRLLPQTLSDFSVNGVNYVPSLISPLPAAILGGGFLLLAVLWPFSGIWPFERFRPQWLSKPLVALLIVVGLALVAAGAAWSVQKDDPYFEGPSPSVVDVNSPVVAPDSDPGPVGTLVGKDGSPAMAVVEKNKSDYDLVVHDIPRAGAYVGKVDLLAGVDGGEATVTVNVRDYWPWALLVIAAGVLLGYFVSLYFTRRREQARQGLRLEELWEDVTLAEAQLAMRAPDVYASYAIHGRVGRRMADIQELLSTGEPDDVKAAATQLADLRAYFNSVQGMWAQLERLADSTSRVAKLIDDADLSVESGDTHAVKEALRLLREPFDDGTGDEDKSGLTARQAEVKAEDELLRELAQSIPTVKQLLRQAAEVSTKGWTTEQIAELGTALEALGNAATKLVTATKAEDARAALAEAGQQAAAIDRLVKRVSGKPAEVRILDGARFSTKWSMVAPVTDLLMADDLIDASGLRPTVSIAVQLVRPGGVEAATDVVVGDLLLFIATVKMPGLLAPTAVFHWSFGDDTSSDELGVVSDEEDLTVQIAHRFSQPGEYTVKLHDSEGELGSAKVNVRQGPGRVERLRTRFAQTDREMTLASGVLAVFSGLLALYTTSPTWGSPGDYMKALLWGSVVSEGSKAVAALVAKTGSPA